jgi:hypothetical protein
VKAGLFIRLQGSVLHLEKMTGLDVITDHKAMQTSALVHYLMP